MSTVSGAKFIKLCAKRRHRVYLTLLGDKDFHLIREKRSSAFRSFFPAPPTLHATYPSLVLLHASPLIAIVFATRGLVTLGRGRGRGRVK